MKYSRSVGRGCSVLRACLWERDGVGPVVPSRGRNARGMAGLPPSVAEHLPEMDARRLAMSVALGFVLRVLLRAYHDLPPLAYFGQ